jgi:hypothetical protein
VRATALPFCCSAQVVGGFKFHPTEVRDEYGNTSRRLPKLKTGLFVSTFTNEAPMKQAYDKLCKENTLLFQSKPRRGNHGLDLFLCVFAHGKGKK